MIESITNGLYFYPVATISDKGYRKICYFDNVVKKRLNFASRFFGVFSTLNGKGEFAVFLRSP